MLIALERAKRTKEYPQFSLITLKLEFVIDPIAGQFYFFTLCGMFFGNCIAD